MAFTKATRENVWVKVLLAGPSGSGKTYSALRLATGLAKACSSRVAAIDTEKGRIRYYADEFDFDDLQLEEPYSPEQYVKAIQDASDAGYKVLVIDSMSHEWNYCLEVHDKMPGNSYTNWGKITPRHDAFMEAILQAPVHIIGTVRGKDEYTIEDKNGKQVPKKIGLGYKQRDNTEYEFTVTFNIAQDTHIADTFKDNTHLFEGRYEVLTEKDGANLYEWANKGLAPAPKPVTTKSTTIVGGENDTTTQAVDLVTVIESIDKLAQSLQKQGVAKADIATTIKQASGRMNYKLIDKVEIAQATLTALKTLGGMTE
ncbi:MAG TPA: AAA family ATPase [Saprospiraceae bacterium]|nr:AAA family ATPase [Saprospiraceae bacterium]